MGNMHNDKEKKENFVCARKDNAV